MTACSGFTAAAVGARHRSPFERAPRQNLWHLPSEHLTIAIAYNDDRPSGPADELLPALLRVALGSEPE